MIQAAIKRSELNRLAQSLSEAARVRPVRGEDPDAVRAFAYRCGRNHARVAGELRKATSEREKVAASDRRYVEYERRRLGIIHSLAKRDARGAVAVDAEQNCEIPDESVPRLTREVDALGVEYADLFREKAAWWGAVTIVDLMSADFDGLPLGVNGCAMWGIREMLLGIPSVSPLRETRVARAELQGLTEAMRAASYVRPHPTDESAEKVRRWRMACGHNFARLSDARDRAAAEREALTHADARYCEYEKRRQDILEEHALRLDDGTVLVDSEGNLDLPADKLDLVAGRIDALALEYQSVLQAREDFWLAPVVVPLMFVPFASVPIRIVGTYLYALAPMLDGAPLNDAGDGIDPVQAVRCGGVPFDP